MSPWVGEVSALTIEALQTHGVFYAGVPEQACLRIKVEAQEGEKLSKVVCNTGRSGKGCIGAAYLYRSDFPFFSTHAKEAACAVKVCKSSAASGQMVFKLNNAAKLKAGANYFWLVYDVSAAAKGGEKVCGELVSATDGAGTEVTPAKKKNGAFRADGKPAVSPGEVFPFKYRIAPYVRPKWACVNNKAMFTEAHLKNMTDFIVFGFSHKGPHLTGAADAVDGKGTDYTQQCMELARELRGKSKTRILAGFSCKETHNPLSAVMHDERKRHILVQELAALVLEQGYEGIDIDWEYPRESGRFKPFATWRKFAVFLAELRGALAGTGASISIAVTTRYDAPNAEVLDGADFINSMSYGRPGEHSTKAAASEDVDFLIKRKIPKVMVVLGLPFFSRDTKPKHQDQGGMGYAAILKALPGLAPSRNVFNHPQTGEQHFFNGPDLIKEKCKTFVLQQGCGGVCIWAYDTDVPLNHPKSLSLALYSVLRQVSR